jgi:hypothetical protein
MLRLPNTALWLALVAAIPVQTACGSDAQTKAGAPPPVPPSSSCTKADPSLAEADAAALFEGSSIPAFDFYLPGERWQELKEHALDEQYVEAEACFNGISLGIVGLRFKGAYGSLRNCFDETGVNSCRKLGMKVKFDEYAKDQRLYGLKRLNFQGYRYDGSYLKEKLSFELYRDMGIVAPRAAWALLRVNDEEQGLFGMVEQIDGRFTSDRFPDYGDGNLYKEVWPGETDETWVREHLETNEDVGDVSSFLAFSQALDAAPESELSETLGEYTDLDYFARYMAVDDAIANFDGITTYYSFENVEEAGNHNFYFYEESPGRFVIIPWDLESTLSLASQFGNVPSWQETSVDCSKTYSVWSGASQVVAPGCDRVFRALGAHLEPYREAARELLDGPFAVDAMMERIERNAAAIRPEARRDPHGPGADQFEQEVGFLRTQLPLLRRRLEHLVSGATATPLVVPVDRVADFEDADEYGLYSGTSLLSNPATTVQVGLETSEPISGSQSLRIGFEFNNEHEPWQQWMFYTVPLSTAPWDATARTGLRFKARSNVARLFRVELESPAQSHASEGIKVGWDVSVGPDVSEQTVTFAAARVPSWATDPGDDLSAILRTLAGVSFLPQCANRGGSGQLPSGTSDSGYVDLDDLELF